MTSKQSLLIESDHIIENIDRNFRLFAGPGAGKTYWLVKHLKNVLRKSRTLCPSSKIACISYTNVASDEVMHRFNTECFTDKVEFTTIHSFLYNNVLKHYLHFLKTTEGDFLVNVKDMDGHEEHVVTYSKIDNWISSLPRQFYYLRSGKDALEITKKCLANMTWLLKDKKPLLVIRKPFIGINKYNIKGKRYSFPTDEHKYQDYFFTYKTQYWADGIIHHDDVLYFAYTLLSKYPSILQFLCHQFPYIFVDEFQDTNPFQSEILRWFASNHTIVGVIGDIAQSIYGFQDAKPELFENFCLDNQDDYVVSGNRRSSNRIVAILNKVRTDIEQKCLSGMNGEQPIAVCGGDHTENIEKIDLYYAEERGNNYFHTVLARNNDLVSKLRGNYGINSGMWDELEKADVEKMRFLYYLLNGFALARQSRFDEAIRCILKVFRPKYRQQEIQLRPPLKGGYVNQSFYCGIAIDILEHFLAESDKCLNSPILNFYNESLSSHLSTFDINLIKIKSKSVTNLLANVCLDHLLCCIRTQDDSSPFRTIHSAKGTQFLSVIVCFDSKSDIDHLLSGNLYDYGDRGEESRIYYVALSRAEEALSLSVINPTKINMSRLEDMGFKIL